MTLVRQPWTLARGPIAVTVAVNEAVAWTKNASSMPIADAIVKVAIVAEAGCRLAIGRGAWKNNRAGARSVASARRPASARIILTGQICPLALPRPIAMVAIGAKVAVVAPR